MNIVDLSLLDLSGVIVGFILTIMVLSYLFGDNPLFRFSVHVFIGVSAGYIVIITLSNIILPQMVFPIINGTSTVLTYLMWIGAFFLVFKTIPGLSRLGNGVMAYLVGVGVAAAIGGAVLGTIFPQSMGVINLFGRTGNVTNHWLHWLNSAIIFFATLTTLLYFQFHVSKRDDHPLADWLKRLGVVRVIGQVFIAITFGVLFVGVYIASISALLNGLFLFGIF